MTFRPTLADTNRGTVAHSGMMNGGGERFAGDRTRATALGGASASERRVALKQLVAGVCCVPRPATENRL